MHYLGIILASIIAYFIGSISWSIIIVRWRRGIDIRTTGSGNAGATNTTRLLGKWWGLSVVFLDAVKVVLATFITILFALIPNKLFSETSFFIPALFVLIGHCWPIYYKFNGGKAVACFLGLLFIINIWYLLIFLAVWFTVICISKRVSVASIAAAVLLVIVIWFPWLSGIHTFAYQWNSADVFWSQAWSHHMLRFQFINYFHELVFHYTSVHDSNLANLINNAKDGFSQIDLANWGFNGTAYYHFGFADGLVESQVVIIVGALLLLLRHLPNMVRISEGKEPETFPKLTDDEKRQLFELQHQPKPNRKQRKTLKRLEQQAKLEAKIKKLNQKLEVVESKEQIEAKKMKQ